MKINLKLDKEDFKKKLGIVEPKVVEPPKIEPETPEAIRDKLESLEGDERLDKSAIKGLEEALNRNKKVYVTGGGSGGTSASFGSEGQIPFTNATGDDFDYATGFEFDGQTLYVPSVAAVLPGTVSRSGNYISSVALTGGKTITVSRSGNYISSITDGDKTWTYTRNGSNQITSWAVA